MDSDEVYPYGWSRKGQRCEARKQGNRGTRERINLVAGLKQGSLIAPVIFTGYCDGRFFLEWMRQELIPSLQPGDTVILDNAPFCCAALRVTPVRRLSPCWKMQDATLCSSPDTHRRTTRQNINGSPSKTLHVKSSRPSQTFMQQSPQLLPVPKKSLDAIVLILAIVDDSFMKIAGHTPV
jgi:DDE superfamily endonuclease